MGFAFLERRAFDSHRGVCSHHPPVRIDPSSAGAHTPMAPHDRPSHDVGEPTFDVLAHDRAVVADQHDRCHQRQSEDTVDGGRVIQHPKSWIPNEIEADADDCRHGDHDVEGPRLAKHVSEPGFPAHRVASGHLHRRMSFGHGRNPLRLPDRLARSSRACHGGCPMEFGLRVWPVGRTSAKRCLAAAGTDSRGARQIGGAGSY